MIFHMNRHQGWTPCDRSQRAALPEHGNRKNNVCKGDRFHLYISRLNDTLYP
jgi:hypothetical protein